LIRGRASAAGGIIIMRSEEARAKAADCDARAEEAADEQTRILFCRLRDSWIRVANHCEFLEAADDETDVSGIAPLAARKE